MVRDRSCPMHVFGGDGDGDKKGFGGWDEGVRLEHLPINCCTEDEVNRTVGKKDAHQLHPTLHADPDGVKVLAAARTSLSQYGHSVQITPFATFVFRYRPLGE